MKKIILAAAAVTGATLIATGATACGGGDKIYVDTNAFFAPFEYYDGNEIVGVDVDIMNLVGEKLGKKVVFENTDFDIIIDNVSNGTQYDCGAAGITITDERAAKVAFSNPYYTSVQYVVYKNENLPVDEFDGVECVIWNNLLNKSIGVQLDTTGDLYVADETDGGALNGTTGKNTQYPDVLAAVADLDINIDVVVIDELPAKYLVQNDNTLKCYPLYYDDGTATEEQYAICVNKNNSELLDAINEVLAELGKDGIDKLVAKHLGIDG